MPPVDAYGLPLNEKGIDITKTQGGYPFMAKASDRTLTDSKEEIPKRRKSRGRICRYREQHGNAPVADARLATNCWKNVFRCDRMAFAY